MPSCGFCKRPDYSFPHPLLNMASRRFSSFMRLRSSARSCSFRLTSSFDESRTTGSFSMGHFSRRSMCMKVIYDRRDARRTRDSQTVSDCEIALRC